MRLRATCMSIADMQRFAELRRKGSSSVTDRLDLLTGHRDAVQRHIVDLQGDLQVLDIPKALNVIFVAKRVFAEHDLLPVTAPAA